MGGCLLGIHLPAGSCSLGLLSLTVQPVAAGHVRRYAWCSNGKVWWAQGEDRGAGCLAQVSTQEAVCHRRLQALGALQCGGWVNGRGMAGGLAVWEAQQHDIFFAARTCSAQVVFAQRAAAPLPGWWPWCQGGS